MTIVEERCYTLKASTTPNEYLALYEAEGLAVQSAFLGEPIGYFATEVGPLNAVVSLWRYESFEDRQTRRGKLAGEKAWQAYLVKVRPLLLAMENRLLTPARFSAVR